MSCLQDVVASHLAECLLLCRVSNLGIWHLEACLMLLLGCHSTWSWPAQIGYGDCTWGPCRSNTWARDPPSRSAEYIWGLPDLTDSQQSIVDLGNVLVRPTIDIAWAVREAGCYFSIENPKLSWLWWFPLIILLWRSPGLIATVFRRSHFGAPWQKGTLMLHPSPTPCCCIHHTLTPAASLTLTAAASITHSLLLHPSLTHCCCIHHTPIAALL